MICVVFVMGKGFRSIKSQNGVLPTPQQINLWKLRIVHTSRNIMDVIKRNVFAYVLENVPLAALVIKTFTEGTFPSVLKPFT